MYRDQSTVTPFFLEVTGHGDWWQVEPGDYGADEICVRRTEDKTEYLIAQYLCRFWYATFLFIPRYLIFPSSFPKRLREGWLTKLISVDSEAAGRKIPVLNNDK
jgi:hypothetical protein